MDESRYKITHLLSKGRTGGTYAAIDGKLQRKVIVQRFFSASGTYLQLAGKMNSTVSRRTSTS